MWRGVFLFLLLMTTSSTALAQNTIHHCVSASGAPVFTDQPCANLDATPAATTDDTHAAPSPLPLTCAQTVKALQQRVVDAFERHDANALAALMQWRGIHQRQGVADVTRLMTLVHQPLASIATQTDDPPDQWPWSDAPVPATSPARVLIVQTGMSDTGMGGRTIFDIIDDSGCMWLAP